MRIQCPFTALGVAIICAVPASVAKTATPPKISKTEAQATALKTVPGKGLNWGLEIEQDGTPTYSFDIREKDLRISEVEIDGNTGKKRGVSIEIEHGDKNGITKTTNAAD